MQINKEDQPGPWVSGVGIPTTPWSPTPGQWWKSFLSCGPRALFYLCPSLPAPRVGLAYWRLPWAKSRPCPQPLLPCGLWVQLTGGYAPAASCASLATAPRGRERQRQEGMAAPVHSPPPAASSFPSMLELLANTCSRRGSAFPQF